METPAVNIEGFLPTVGAPPAFTNPVTIVAETVNVPEYVEWCEIKDCRNSQMSRDPANVYCIKHHYLRSVGRWLSKVLGLKE